MRCCRRLREQTRTDHLRQVAAYLGWRSCGPMELKALDDFLLLRAMEHDAPGVLFHLACEHLRSERIIRPGVITLVERVGAAREAAWTETHQRLAAAGLLTADRCEDLDDLLEVTPSLGRTRLAWLGEGATQATPKAIKAELDKLTFLRGLDADTFDVGMLAPERRRWLAGIGRRSTNQALQRRPSVRRYSVLLATITEAAVEILDELLGMYDQAVSATEQRARHRLDEQLAERARAGESRQGLLDDILEIACDLGIADEDVGGLLRGRLGLERLLAARRDPAQRPPRDHGHLALIEASYGHVREFAPAVLATIRFVGGTDARPLLAAVEVLRELNATGSRKVPDGAPTSFVPARWRGYLERAATAGNTVAYRHYWELCVLLALRDALRAGDVWVPGSRRYADPASYLIPLEAWPGRRGEFCQLTGTPIDADAAFAVGERHLDAALADLDRLLGADASAASDARTAGPVRLNDAGELVVGRLPAEDLPDGVAELRAAVVELLPRPQIAELLIEVDRHTGFSDHLTHAGGKTSRPPVLRRNLYAAILAQACNLGLAGMAEASGISYDALAWTTEWYLREETLDVANTAIVNHHHHPLAAAWGGGTLSSSDGQRFPVRGRSLTARRLSRYFVDEGISAYTHVSDQHATYGTKVIVATDREATYVLDAILGNQTDLQIAEHVTDTHGQTLLNFALFDLLGKQLSPRIRDLGAITLYRLNTRGEVRGRFPNAGHLLTGKLNAALIREHWDDLLRLAASLKFGYATASLLVAKLQAGSRQNALAAALQEYGKLIRTVHAVRYLVDETYQRKITRQLNKGETLHALRRDLLFAHDGALRRRHHDQQTEQALCHTLVTNAIVAWNTVYIGLALDALGAGAGIDQELVGHLSPALLEHIRVYGTYTFDVDAEWRRAGYRPLREPAERQHGGT